MLSVFPLMFLSLLGHALLRIATGLVLFSYGIERIRKSERSISRIVLGIIELTLGTMITVGVCTQIAALGLFFYAVGFLIFRKKDTSGRPTTLYILLIGISLSLTITGAGAFAIDMPF